MTEVRRISEPWDRVPEPNKGENEPWDLGVAGGPGVPAAHASGAVSPVKEGWEPTASAILPGGASAVVLI